LRLPELLEPAWNVLLLDERDPDDPDVNLELEPLVLELMPELIEEPPPVEDAPAPNLEEPDEKLDPEEDPEEMPPAKDPDEPELVLDNSGISPWKQPAHNGPSPTFVTTTAPELADPNELVLALLAEPELKEFDPILLEGRALTDPVFTTATLAWLEEIDDPELKA